MQPKLPSVPESKKDINTDHQKQNAGQNRLFNYLRRLCVLVVIVLMMYGAYHFLTHHFQHTDQTTGPHSKPVIVQTASVTVRDVPVYIKALGNVGASTSIVIRTQINGQLTKILFKQGQNVQQGDLLAEIDDRGLQAQLLQYQGQLQRDQALLENARLDMQRYLTLDKKNFVPGQTVDTQRELIKQYEGTVESDQGMLDNARVNLSYCKIKAPVAGRLGLQLIDPGNYVQTSDAGGIVTLNVLQPISITFSVPEDQLPEILQQYNQQTHIIVEAFDRSQTQHLQTGQLTAIDNQIDPTTGMIKLKANFDNQPIVLFPNQFVNIRLLLRTQKDALIIPSSAIQYGTQGPYVYVLGDDETVKVTYIGLGINLETEETIVNAGLIKNQQIVMEGTEKLKDGIKVSIGLDNKSPAHTKPGTGTQITSIHKVQP